MRFRYEVRWKVRSKWTRWSEFGVVDGGFAYRADLLAWSGRPVRTRHGLKIVWVSQWDACWKPAESLKDDGGAVSKERPKACSFGLPAVELPDVLRRPSMIGLAEQQRSGVRCGVQSLRDKWTKRASMRLIILCQGNGSYNTSHCRAALHGSTTSLSPSWPPSPMLPCWARYFLLRIQRNRPVFLAKWESAKHLPRKVSIQISYRRRRLKFY
jgi:hypothetical protein